MSLWLIAIPALLLSLVVLRMRLYMAPQQASERMTVLAASQSIHLRTGDPCLEVWPWETSPPLSLVLSVLEFGSVGKDELIDFGLKVFPEPFVLPADSMAQ